MSFLTKRIRGVRVLDLIGLGLLISLILSVYLAKTIEVRRLRYRDMDTDQQYFLAFHVKCDVCGAGVAEDCRNLRKPGSYNEKPHYDRLVSGYQATHFRQIAGLGYPDD